MGAIPTSLIVGKLFQGIDLREHGSRNLGATNVYRVLGWKYAIPVALLDILKGTIPVLLFAPRVSPSLVTALLIGIAAIVGHVYSVFAGFKGGKGVATATGVMLGLTPAAVGVVAAAWILIVWLTGYVSLGSIVGAAGPPVRRLLHVSGTQGSGLDRCAGGRGDHLVPPRQHPAPAGRHREPLRPSRGDHLMRIAVLGAGSWGTTLANLLARKGEDVCLWAYEPDVVEAINTLAPQPDVPARLAAGARRSARWAMRRRR